VDGIPDSVEVGNFVGEKLEKIQSHRDPQHHGICDDFERGGQVDYAEALEHAESGDGGVKIQAGRKASAQG
jgi:hypothetical protein